MPTAKKGLAGLVEGLPPTYWLIWTGTLINRLGGFVIPFLTLYLTQQRGIPISQAAFVVSLFGAGSFIAQLTGGELTDRLGRRPVMLMSFFITPIFMVALGLARRPYPYLALDIHCRIFHRSLSTGCWRGHSGFGTARVTDARLRI